MRSAVAEQRCAQLVQRRERQSGLGLRAGRSCHRASGRLVGELIERREIFRCLRRR
jgi:hypothetical protein